jgi:hypothetical protein
MAGLGYRDQNAVSRRALLNTSVKYGELAVVAQQLVCAHA